MCVGENIASWLHLGLKQGSQTQICYLHICLCGLNGFVVLYFVYFVYFILIPPPKNDQTLHTTEHYQNINSTMLLSKLAEKAPGVSD